jgi:recombination protein RecT
MEQQTQQQTAPTTVATSQSAVALKRFQEETADMVLERVNTMTETGELVLPANYHAGNAVKLAWLYLQTVTDRNNRPAVDVCTKESICNCFLEMIIKGLSVAKKQCYFIVTGNQLSFWEDYRGKLMRAKRDTEVAEVNAQVIYEGDKFVYTVDENGEYQLTSHETNLANIDINKIVGAYAVVIRKNGTRFLEVMTMAQIRNSWQQGAAKGTSGAHTKFTDQMCKKTVISRACKIALGSAEDEDTEARPDEAMAERNAAQVPTQQPQQQIVDAAVEDVTELASEVVDTATGEVLNAQPAAHREQPKKPQVKTSGTPCPL